MAFYLVLCSLLAGVAFLFVKKVGSRETDLPPGPPTLPFIGNLHVFPREAPHHQFTEWAKQYGGIYSLKIGPGTAIVLSDPNIVKVLLEKRSATTSDRPSIYIVKLVTRGLHMGLNRYGETWKAMRRAAHAILTPQAATRQLPIQQAEAVQLLYDFLNTPESFHRHLGRYTNSAIMSVLFGKRSPRYETRETSEFFRMMHDWAALLEPGATPPFDLIPILKLIPQRWSAWKRAASRIRVMQRALYFGYLEDTEKRVENGEENGSYMEEVLARREEFGLDREMTAYVGGVLVEGASETTWSYLNSFILTLVAFPEAQKKAHEEIDRVVGQDRLATLADFEQLPYIRALLFEVHRFRPVAPLLVPHVTTINQRIENYIIPKGSTIFVNAWGILHDPELFDDPESFQPERYLITENGTKPGIDASSLKTTLTFGVGRRSCPGIHLAQTSMSIVAMNLLWAFDFKPALDAQGNEIAVDLFAYSKGVTMAPLPFECRITPRTGDKAEIIRREFLDATDVFEKFEFGLSADDKAFVERFTR
ncbi:cytochrome P450 [Roridomyces roridus]|uniref:Cytochrome P450 n=1 Tax=Roridomyces roridus TaxID=1738132 RepID=A0AAD7BXX1_9AGAR|nr:cytochrome P450 [Roridomyces roridus]